MNFFAIALHELGHTFSLRHVFDVQSIMLQSYQGRELTKYDRDMISSLYGKFTHACFATVSFT